MKHWKDIKTKLANIVGTKCDSKDLMLFAELAQESILASGKYKGTVERACFCCYQNCLSLPKRYETILEVTSQFQDFRVKNLWYEFSGIHFYNRTFSFTDFSGCCDPAVVVDQGTGFPVLYDMTEDYPLTVYPKINQPGKYIIIEGIDDVGREIVTYKKSDQGEQVVDFYGEKLELIHGNTTRRIFCKVTAIRAEQDLDIDVSIFAGNQIVAVLEAGEYETNYRRYKIPAEWRCGCVEALVKLAPTRIMNDNSLVVIDNILAMAFMIQAIESNRSGGSALSEGEAYRGKAIREVSNQWEEHMPATKANPVRVDFGTKISRRYYPI